MAESKQAANEVGNDLLPPYYLSVFSIAKRGRREALLNAIHGAKPLMETPGGTRIALSYGVTGPVWEFMEVYRLPALTDVPSLLHRLEQDPTHQELSRECQQRRMELSQGMPYDEGSGGAASPPMNYERNRFLHAVLTLKEGAEQEFIKHMEVVREDFHAQQWKLLFAGRSHSIPRHITHLWKFGDADELYQLMVRLRAHPSYALLDACCEGQWQRLLRGLDGMQKERCEP
jgi:hypothetical protein